MSLRKTQTSVADSSSSRLLAKSGWQLRIELWYARLMSRSVAVGACGTACQSAPRTQQCICRCSCRRKHTEPTEAVQALDGVPKAS